MRKDMTMDMCSGPLFGNLLRFSVPLMLSGILQLLFNSAISSCSASSRAGTPWPPLVPPALSTT